MIIAVEDKAVAGLVLAIVWGSFIVGVALFILFVNLNSRYGRLPRGFRWLPGVWSWMKREPGDLTLRLFYPEVWAERFAARTPVVEPVEDRVKFDADKGRFVSMDKEQQA